MTHVKSNVATNRALRSLAKTILIGSAVVMLTAGCKPSSGPYTDLNGLFPPESKTSQTTLVLDAQAAAGARANATLQGYHFDGEQLNSLGRQKLEMIMRDTDCTTPSARPLVVYINVPADASTTNGRREAVTKYLTDTRLATASEFSVELGRNPGDWHGSQPSLLRMSKTESPDAATAGGLGTGASVSVGGDAK